MDNNTIFDTSSSSEEFIGVDSTVDQETVDLLDNLLDTIETEDDTDIEITVTSNETPDIGLSETHDTGLSETHTNQECNIDFSFIKESNHLTMCSTINSFIRDGKIDMNNSDKLFNSLNDYYQSFCDNLDSRVQNTKYFGFRFPNTKPNRLNDVQINNYINRLYPNQDINVIKTAILNYIQKEPFNSNDSKSYQSIYSDIILVRVKEYSNLVLTDKDLDKLDDYTNIYNNNRNFYYCSSFVNHIQFSKVRNESNNLDFDENEDYFNSSKNIIRVDYLNIGRYIYSYYLSRIRSQHNKYKLCKDICDLYRLTHDSSGSGLSKNYNFTIFESNLQLIRNVFEFITFIPTHYESSNNELNIFNTKYDNLYTNNKSLTNNSICLYYIGNEGYSYNHQNSRLGLMSKNLEFKSCDAKIWITNYNINDIKVTDVLPFQLIIKNNIKMIDTIHDNFTICEYLGDRYNRYSKFQLLVYLLDNSNRFGESFKIKYNYFSNINHNNKVELMLLIKKGIISKSVESKDFMNHIMVSNMVIKRMKLVNSAVYINVLNTEKSKVQLEYYDDKSTERPVYTYNKDKLSVSPELDTLLKSSINVDLFDYQKSNVVWMKNIEDNIVNDKLKYKFNILKDCSSLKNDDYFVTNYENKKIVLKKNYCIGQSIKYKLMDYEDLKVETQSKVSIPGGVLCDEVGLGKTLSTVSHIITQLETDKHMKETGIIKYDINNLLILPARLVSQWIFEINKYIKDPSKVNIVKVATLTDVKKLDKQLAANKISYDKIDILIICANLLINDKYIQLIEQNRKKYISHTERFKFLNLFETNFNRIIVDEIHEITIPYEPYGESHNYLFYKYKHKILKKKDSQLLEKINTSFRSNFKWCLTATPFNYGPYNLMGILNFLLHTENKCKYQKSENDYGIVKGFNNEEQMQEIINCHFKGIKKNDVRNVIDIPIFTEKIIKINLSNIEKNIYQTHRTNNGTYMDTNSLKRLFLICTNICIANLFNQVEEKGKELKVTTLEEMNKMMINKFKTAKNKAETSKKKLVDNIPKYKENYQKFLSLNEMLKEIVDLKDYKTYYDQSKYYLDELFEIYKQAVKNEELDDFGIPINSYNSQTKLVICNIMNLAYKSLNKVYPIIGENYHEYMNAISSIDDKYTLSNTVDDLIKSEDLSMYNIAISNVGYSVLNKPLTNNVVKGYLHKVSRIHYRVNKDNFDNSDIKIKSLDNDIKRYDNQIKLFSSNDFIKEKTSDPCMICFEEFDKVVVTKCRHVFCGDCHNIMSKNNKCNYSCPECRGNVVSSQVIMTTMEKINEDSKAKEKQEEESGNKVEEVVIDKKNLTTEEILKVKEWRNQCINKYGSKMTYLIEYLQEILTDAENRVIIFSQYDNMLGLIGKTLDEYKIKNVFCKGNVNTVNKRINMFKSDESIRVIMLSSERSNSGSNLTEANHIILVDVLNAEKNTTKDIESQAIGRAVRLGQKKPVTVTRLITTGTIEEEFYNKNKYDISEIQ